MKEKDGIVECSEHQLVLYVEKDDGTYGPLRTGSYITMNFVDDYWAKREKLEKEYLEKIKNGQATPVEMYMVLGELTPSELASRARLSRRKVMKHCRPGSFGSATVDELKRYADIFGVTLQCLLQAHVVETAGLSVNVRGTANPYFNLVVLSREGK